MKLRFRRATFAAGPLVIVLAILEAGQSFADEKVVQKVVEPTTAIVPLPHFKSLIALERLQVLPQWKKAVRRLQSIAPTDQIPQIDKVFTFDKLTMEELRAMPLQKAHCMHRGPIDPGGSPDTDCSSTSNSPGGLDFLVVNNAWYASCDANWDTKCSGDTEYRPPSVWEICNYVMTVDSLANQAEAKIVEADRNHVKLHLWANGSGVFFDQYGASVHTRMSYLSLILSDGADQPLYPDPLTGNKVSRRLHYACNPQVPYLGFFGPWPSAGQGGQNVDMKCVPSLIEGQPPIEVCRTWVSDPSSPDGKKYTDDWHPCGFCTDTPYNKPPN